MRQATLGRSVRCERSARVDGRTQTPPTRTDAAPAARSSLRRKNRAPTIPWTKARATRRWQVSWLTGRCSTYGLPGSWPMWRPIQWLHLARKMRCTSRSPLTVAGTASAWGRLPPLPCSLLNPSQGTSAIIAFAGDSPTRQFARTREIAVLQDRPMMSKLPQPLASLTR